MGGGLAARLLSAGYQTRVFNRSLAKAERLAPLGAVVCQSPAEASAGAEVIFAMTSDDESSRAVWLGSEGALSGKPAAEAFAIECSTLSHDWVLELSEQARARGLRYIDAPVTGLPDAAAAGRLTMLVGAEAEDLEQARPFLNPLSERIIHFGKVGSGTAYKLMINLIGAVQIASAAEGMALAERAGLALAKVADAIALGQAASPQVVRNTQRMVLGDHRQSVVFTPALRLKDVDYALKLADKLGVTTRFGDVAAALLRLCVQFDSQANESIVFELLRARDKEG